MLLTVDRVVTLSVSPYLTGRVDSPFATVVAQVSDANGVIGRYPGINAIGVWTAKVTDVLPIGEYEVRAEARPLFGPIVISTGTLVVEETEETEDLDIGQGPGSDTVDPMNPPDVPVIRQSWEIGGRHPKSSARVRMYKRGR